MNRERRRFIGLATLASSALLRARMSALSAEADQGSGAAAKTQAPSAAPEPTTIELTARLRAGGDLSGTGQPLTYGDPCPVLRLRKGSEVKIHLTNTMTEPTSIEWHGMRLPNMFEGLPGSSQSIVAPGASAAIALKPVDSGTCWFHPAVMPGVPDQTARGLAGVAVVDDPGDPPVDRDKVLFLADPVVEAGILVNGHAGPETEQVKPGARLRLRIVNGSTRRALAATFQGARPMVVAIDGQPSALFAPLNDVVPMGPGARFDVVVDVPRSPGGQFNVSLRGAGPAGAEAPDRPFYVVTSQGDPRPDQAPIGPLAPNPALPRAIPLEHATRADMAVQYRPPARPGTGPGLWTVNGVSAEPLSRKPLFSVKRNTPVTLGFSNKTGTLTGFRLHGHVMRLLHPMDDGWEPYWRDSVLAPPGVTQHAAFLADNAGRWLIESPFFNQAAAGLRTWFEVR